MEHAVAQYPCMRPALKSGAPLMIIQKCAIILQELSIEMQTSQAVVTHGMLTLHNFFSRSPSTEKDIAPLIVSIFELASRSCSQSRAKYDITLKLRRIMKIHLKYIDSSILYNEKELEEKLEYFNKELKNAIKIESYEEQPEYVLRKYEKIFPGNVSRLAHYLISWTIMFTKISIRQKGNMIAAACIQLACNIYGIKDHENEWIPKFVENVRPNIIHNLAAVCRSSLEKFIHFTDTKVTFPNKPAPANLVPIRRKKTKITPYRPITDRDKEVISIDTNSSRILTPDHVPVKKTHVHDSSLQYSSNNAKDEPGYSSNSKENFCSANVENKKKNIQLGEYWERKKQQNFKSASYDIQMVGVKRHLSSEDRPEIPKMKIRRFI